MESDDEIPTLIEHDPEQTTDPKPIQAHEISAKRVPLTIICGFLGAGKSTLLKRILTERHGYRIAVIMNEFADTADIEARTINVSSADDPEAQQGEEILELANGCLCCSIKDQGVAAIEKLMARKGAFDHILLETTGLADPGPIASMFWQNEEYTQGLGRDITLDGVLCVVDAVFGKQQMLEDEAIDGLGESLRQIGGSDVIILNKIDLVSSPSVLAETEQLIRKVNPAAPLYKTIQAQIDLKHIIGIQAYSSDSISPSLKLGLDRGSATLTSSESESGAIPSDPQTVVKEAQGSGLPTEGLLASGSVTSSSSMLGKQPGLGQKEVPDSLLDPHRQQYVRHPHGDLGNEHDHDHTHHHDGSEHTHEPRTTQHYELRGISSIQVTCPILTPTTLQTLEKWIQSVLWENQLPDSELTSGSGTAISGQPPALQVLRSKGLFTLTNGDQYILQGVRNIYDLSRVEGVGPGDSDTQQQTDGLGIQQGKIVLIGKGLDQAVRTSLERVFGYGARTETG